MIKLREISPKKGKKETLQKINAKISYYDSLKEKLEKKKQDYELELKEIMQPI